MSNEQRAFSFQIKHKGVKHAFIVIENSSGMPTGIVSYKGAIVARPGKVYSHDGQYYFKGFDMNARAKTLLGKMSTEEDVLTRVIALALASNASPLSVVGILEASNTVFSKILIKGIRKYYKNK